MQVVNTVAEVRRLTSAAWRAGHTIGLVPTMGFLHDGHAALIRVAAAECELVVVSVFVNPTQFGPSEDFHTYPRDLQRDVRTCQAAGAHMVFAPAVAEMYPDGFRTHVEVRGLGDLLCGASRPGHFRGVATVVAKLFGIVRPDRAYFGQKDYQQTLVIRRMVADLNMPVEVRVIPTVRHPDGLAMSSRNIYLSSAERAGATVLHRTLQLASQAIAAGERDVATLDSDLKALIAGQPLARLDYLAIIDPEDLSPLDQVAPTTLVALAVRIGRTRLIDNILITTPTAETAPEAGPY